MMLPALGSSLIAGWAESPLRLAGSGSSHTACSSSTASSAQAGCAMQGPDHATEAPERASDRGADDGIRTRDPNLGKVVLYQLSHVRVRLTP
jgi:hypothetical protein